MEKQRLAHVSIGHVAMRTLPMTQTILTGIAIGIFPLLVLAAVFNKLTLSVLKGYVFALMWLQSWPMLYAILNSAMTFYAKQNGAPVVLSEISQIQLKYSDLASTAGYLSMMIPPLSWMMVRGLGAGFSSVYSHFASSAISPFSSCPQSFPALESFPVSQVFASGGQSIVASASASVLPMNIRTDFL